MILMDCEMPNMNGYEATRAIRDEEDKNKKEPTPIIALTAHATLEHKEKCFECGMNGYISKPFTLSSMRQGIEESLQSGQ
jgi:CheY-like chemotaxis protein